MLRVQNSKTRTVKEQKGPTFVTYSFRRPWASKVTSWFISHHAAKPACQGKEKMAFFFFWRMFVSIKQGIMSDTDFLHLELALVLFPERWSL